MPKLQPGADSFRVGPPGVIGTYFYSLEKNCVFADKGLAAYFNVPQRRAASGEPLRTFLDALLDEDRETLQKAIYEALNGYDIRAIYHVSSQSYGRRRLFDAGSCLFDEDGLPIAITGYLFDITGLAHPLSREALQRSLDAALWNAQALNLDVIAYLTTMAKQEADRL